MQLILSRSEWCFGYDNLFNGSYSHFTSEMVAAGLGISDLSSPIFRPDTQVPLIQFAGEHCHATEYSVLNGAHKSAVAQAQLLANCYESAAKL